MENKFTIETNFFFHKNTVDVVVVKDHKTLQDIVNKELGDKAAECGAIFINNEVYIDNIVGLNLGTIYISNDDFMCIEAIAHECAHVVNLLWITFLAYYETRFIEVGERGERESVYDIALERIDPRFEGKAWDSGDELIAHATGRLVADICTKLIKSGYSLFA